MFKIHFVLIDLPISEDELIIALIMHDKYLTFVDKSDADQHDYQRAHKTKNRHHNESGESMCRIHIVLINMLLSNQQSDLRVDNAL